MKAWRVCLVEAMGPPIITMVTEINGKICMVACRNGTQCAVNPEYVYPVREFPRLAQQWVDACEATASPYWPIDAVPPLAERL